MGKKLSIIIPVFNEKNTIREVIRRVSALKIDKEIIAVDDGSTDGTAEKLTFLAGEFPDLTVMHHDENCGKGACIRDGFKRADGDIAIIQDADLEYNPEDIPKVIQPIVDGYADVVYGSRFTGYPRRALYFWHSIGNRFLTFLSNLLTNLNLTDMESGYKAFSRIAYKNIKISSNTFTVEPEITAKIARMRLRVYEVPISYLGRSYWEGKKINWIDGIKAMFAMFWHSFFSTISDDVGFQTLEVMNGSEGYNRYVYKTLKRYVGERVLEVGSGIGNLTKFMAQKDFVVASDVSESYLHILNTKFGRLPNFSVRRLDLETFDPEDIKGNKFDTVLCLNVLEHLEDDLTPLKKLNSILGPDGHLILLVPAHQWAFGSLDVNLGHFRRYSDKRMDVLARESGFKLVDSFYINSYGIIGWFVSGKIFRKKSLSKLQVKLFNLSLPLLKMEKLVGPPFGLSIVTVLKKD